MANKTFYEILRDCFNAGYQFPQWADRHGYRKILFLCPSSELLWEIRTQMLLSKKAIVSEYMILDGGEETKECNYSVACTINGVVFKNYASHSLNNWDCVVVLSEKKINLQANNLITIERLVNEFITYVYAERPIYYYLIANPGVKVILTAGPAISALQNSKDELTDAERWILDNPTWETRKLISKQHATKQFIPTSLDIFGYSNEEFMELTFTPPSKTNLNGSTVFKTDFGGLLNIQDGIRCTSDQPKKWEHTVYCMGTCTFVGYCTPWNKTFESYLQRDFNDQKIPYRVVNASQYYASRYQDIFYNLHNLNTQPGDIILLCLQNLKVKGVPFFNPYQIFKRPHNYGEVFSDPLHLNERGYEVLATHFLKYLQENNFFKDYKYKIEEPLYSHIYGIPEYTRNNSQLSGTALEGLLEYKDTLRDIRRRSFGETGAIVMNCNPFTLGHRYLIEYASSRVSRLFVFVVEEDRSVFPFKDRIELVRKGTQDLPNVFVMPSGRFVLSALTFSGYFNKSELQDTVVDSSSDVELFAKEIAPVLGIDVRFVGMEPLDNVTKQYNETMKSILPKYGIRLEEIPRKESGGAVISASRVRTLLKEGDFKAISEIVPDCTLDYLKLRNIDIIAPDLIKRFDEIWTAGRSEKLDEVVKEMLPLAEYGNPNLCGRLGRAYRDGRGAERDYKKAAYWMLKAANQGIGWAKWEYYDILWRINSPESLSTMIEYGQKESNAGNTELRARLARAYRDGKGVEKDLNKAAELMESVLSGNPPWAKWEYIDILLMLKTPESDRKAFEYANMVLSLGKEIDGRLGRMYRDGRGVEQDLNLAVEHMRKAADQNLWWSNWELFDILWMIDTPESLNEMIEKAIPLAESGNGQMQGRLGRAYREGKGVEKDLNKAAKWMKKAADQKISWAIQELAQINAELHPTTE